ncbi:TIM barrel protein [Virgibacillus sp. JSM 102003]|uniref:TIM barrel protein n=1 Tax=Virgibacillus sp. JSM 102003 TaxID=1562108 RepID=UPI0035C1BC19
MKLAAMNITYKYYPLEYFLDSVQRLNFDQIELWAGEPHLFVYRNLLHKLRYIRNEINSRGLSLACYTPEQCVYPYNLAASNEDWRKQSVAYFKENILAACELDAKKMLVTSGIGDYSISHDESWKYACESINELSHLAVKEGITLVLEPLTYLETNLVMNRHHIRKMLDEVNSPNLKAMIDVVAMDLENETVDDYFDLFGNDLVHFHLMDGDHYSDAHLSIGEGVLPIKKYINELKENNYTGTCTLEIMDNTSYLNPENSLRNSVYFLNKTLNGV